MVFSIGTKVRLIYTGDEGVVEELLEHGLIAIRLNDGEVIPVGADALERSSEVAASRVKAKFVPGKKKVEPLPLQPLPIDNQYTVLKPQGLQLAFDPVFRADGSTDYYRIYLINDTQLNFLYQLGLHLDKRGVWNTQGRLGPRTMIEAGSLQYSELNNSAEVHIENWRLLPDGKGTGGKLTRILKLKPTQFFKKITTAPYLNRQVYLYQLFTPKEMIEKQASPKQLPPKESLKDYTSRETQNKSSGSQWFNLQEMPHEVWEMAAFKNEIDLHIQSLVDDPSAVPRQQILSTQLYHFERFMQDAIRIGVDRVFVIHGIGEGKLREAVEARLRAMSEVKSFKNEYHARYGYGATEVLF
ncbi:Smr/MutS family protein [Lewinella cohaerens]|uniref:Smr/MutS family protein n=1 Tax=Lewinella cohaerens TaxID=70995 RepID=UPI0003794CAF|nr:Smr/MutS family protein [Lewinella cohaerens]